MDDSARLQLDKMIAANNVEDCTQDIRDKKHSGKIRDDVTKMLELKKKYERLSKSNPSQFDAMLFCFAPQFCSSILLCNLKKKTKKQLILVFVKISDFGFF